MPHVLLTSVLLLTGCHLADSETDLYFTAGADQQQPILDFLASREVPAQYERFGPGRGRFTARLGLRADLFPPFSGWREKYNGSPRRISIHLGASNGAIEDVEIDQSNPIQLNARASAAAGTIRTGTYVRSETLCYARVDGVILETHIREQGIELQDSYSLPTLTLRVPNGCR